MLCPPDQTVGGHPEALSNRRQRVYNRSSFHFSVKAMRISDTDAVGPEAPDHLPCPALGHQKILNANFKHVRQKGGYPEK